MFEDAAGAGVGGERAANRPRLRIFLSYRREDSSGYAGRLWDALVEAFGREAVFMDIDTIAPGRTPDVHPAIPRRLHQVPLVCGGRRYRIALSELLWAHPPLGSKPQE